MSKFYVKVSKSVLNELPFDLTQLCMLLGESFQEYKNTTEAPKGDTYKIWITDVRLSTEFFIQIEDAKKNHSFSSSEHLCFEGEILFLGNEPRNFFVDEVIKLLTTFSKKVSEKLINTVIHFNFGGGNWPNAIMNGDLITPRECIY